MIDVLVVDDHPVVREGLAAMLRVEPDINVVGEAGDGAEALAMATRLRPHVVLMDLRMPRLDGAGATARLAVEVPETKVLVLTTYDTDTDIMRAVEAGATGYLLKDTPRPQLVEAVRAAARGETILAPPVAAKLVDRMRVSSSGTPAPVLTKRQLEVLSLVAEGHTNAEIGRRLHIGESTVKTHLLHVFEKLGVSDRTRAVMRAMELRLLPEPPRASQS